MSAAGLASPCVSVCVLDPVTGFCRGCRRTIDEIAAWPRLDAEAQQRILATLPARAADTLAIAEIAPK